MGGFAWSAAEVWLRQILQGAAFVLMARLLGPDAWGLFGIALIFITAARILLSEGGWALALVRAPELSPDLVDTVFWAALGTAALSSVLLVLAAAPLASWFGQPELEAVLWWVALALTLEAAGLVPRALLMRRFDFRPLAVRSVLGTAAAGCAGTAAALAGAGVWSFVWYHLAQTATETIVLWTTGRWRPGFRVSAGSLRRVATFVAQVSGERASVLLDLVIPRVLLGQQAGPGPLGHYTLARKVFELGTQLVVVPMTRVALPSFAEMQADRERLRGAAATALQACAAVSLPAFVGLAIVAGDLVPLVLGRHWAPAAPHVQLALLLGPAFSLSGVLASLLLALGRGRELLLVGAAGTAFLVALLALLPAVTVSGVLLAALVQAYVTLPLRMAAAARAVGLPLPALLRRLTPALAATGAMALSILGLRAAGLDTLPHLPLQVATGAAVYAGLLACLDRSLVATVLDVGRSLLGRRPARPGWGGLPSGAPAAGSAIDP